MIEHTEVRTITGTFVETMLQVVAIVEVLKPAKATVTGCRVRAIHETMSGLSYQWRVELDYRTPED